MSTENLDFEVLPYVLSGDIIDNTQKQLFMISTGESLTGTPTCSQTSDDPYGTLNLTSYQLYKNVETLYNNMLYVNESNVSATDDMTILGNWVFNEAITSTKFIGNGSELTNISYNQLDDLPNLPDLNIIDGGTSAISDEVPPLTITGILSGGSPSSTMDVVYSGGSPFSNSTIIMSGHAVI